MGDFRSFHCLSATGIALMLLATLLMQRSAANEPVRESLRGGAGEPVVEIPDVRKQNNDRDDKYEKYADGLYVLPIFQTVSADRAYQVDVWNLLVGPGQETTKFELPGTAILLVRAGSAMVVIDDGKRAELEMGGTLVLKPQSTLQITNQEDDRPISVRVTLFSGRE